MDTNGAHFMNKSILVKIAIGAVGLYALSTAISYAAFSFLSPSSAMKRPTNSGKPVVTVAPSKFAIEEGLPRTEVCPMNGVKYPTKYREIWEKRRPLAVMIENSRDARPQSGMSLADIVYEAVAEGGTTRFMGIFYCGATLGNINLSPVRSARIYFVNWVPEYDALYNHVGGAGRCEDETVDPRAKALCAIGKYGIKDMDQFGISFPDCYRNYDRLDHPVATEHTMVCKSDNLYKIAIKREWTNVDENGVPWDKNYVAWKFKEEAKEADRGSASPIEFIFWEGYKDYAVRFEYDKTNNLYKRFTAGEAHKDLETGEQLSAKNIVIQFAKETRGLDEHAHLLYDTIGSGKAILFQDGNAMNGTWRKDTRTARTKFYDENSREVAFNPGQIWIELVPIGVTISYPK